MIKKFELNDTEYQKAVEFEKKHRHYSGAIGGHISVEFSLTGLGCAKTVKCFICDESENITDYSHW